MDDKRTRSCSLLASVENVNIKRFKVDESEQVLKSYGWHKPEKSITERRKQTETRREELLNLIYQDGIGKSQVEEMIKEWISLVVERDRLLREQVDKERSEEKNEYFRRLKQFLKDEPPLGDASEEVDIRDTLLSLEKHVSQYCRKHQITSPPASKVQFRSERQSRPHACRDSVRGSLHKSLHQQDILDHETGQTGIPIIGDSSQSSAGSSGISRNISPAVESYRGAHTGPVAHTKTTTSTYPQSLPSMAGAGVTKSLCQDHRGQTFGGLAIPPLPPPPPPISPSSSCPVTSVRPRGGMRGVAGTVQFASSNVVCTGISVSDIEPQQKENVTPYSSSVVTDCSQDRSNAACQPHPDPPLDCTFSSGDRQNLMDEITSAGRSVLRRTSRPKSPGGTPMKLSRNRLTLTGNTDMLQRALISKFRSLHSTPIRRCSPVGVDKSGSFDTSNAWSDINSSCAVYEDPDLSSTPPSSYGPPNYSTETKDTTNQSNNVDPNSSTAV